MDDEQLKVAREQLFKNLMLEMRNWLLDCGCDRKLLATKSDDEVLREVERRYEGGIEAFLREMV